MRLHGAESQGYFLQVLPGVCFLHEAEAACFTSLPQKVDLIAGTGNFSPFQRDKEHLSDAVNVRRTCCSHSYSLCLWKILLISYCPFPTGVEHSFRVFNTAFQVAVPIH